MAKEYKMLDAMRELNAYGFEQVNETELTSIWKDKKGRTISVAKDYESCSDFLKQLHLKKLKSLHEPQPALFEEAYIIEETGS